MWLGSVPWFDLQCVIVKFHDHIHFFYHVCLYHPYKLEHDISRDVQGLQNNNTTFVRLSVMYKVYKIIIPRLSACP